jgi:hypothetical protein
MKRYKPFFKESIEDSYFGKYAIKVEGSKIKFDRYKFAISNKCELNAYNYAKENNMLPVWGLALDDHNRAIEHWWVYDPNTKTHIEVSLVTGLNGDRYANIIKPEVFNKSNSYKEMMPILIPRDTIKG